MSTSVIDRSNNCIRAARETYQLLVTLNGSTTSSVVKKSAKRLTSLEEDARYLCKSANDILSRAMSQERSLNSTLQHLQDQKQELEMMIISANEKKADLERRQCSVESRLQSKNQQLQQAQNDTRNAEIALEHAREKRRRKRRGLIGGIKRALGLTKSADERVQREKANLQRCQSEQRSAHNEVSQARQAVLNVQREIERHNSELQIIKQRVNEVHEKIGSAKCSIAILRKSEHFWDLFIVAAENAEERTTALKNIVDQADEEQEYEILLLDGTVTKAESFIEAWELLCSQRL